MKLNKLEFFLMNNPLRNFIQEYIEIKRLRKLSDLKSNTHALEIGCGVGNGSRLIKKYFQVKTLDAIDIDEKMIQIAGERNTDESIFYYVQSATQLKFSKNTFDAIFDFGVIHHIPNWKTCLRELKRVVKSRGYLIIEDLSLETFSTPIGKLLKKSLKHPYASMYHQEEFIEYLKKIGFRITQHNTYKFGIRYFVVIAQKR